MPQRAFALHLPAPLVAVLRLDPATLPGHVPARPALRDDALELLLADRLPQRLAIVECLWRPPLPALKLQVFENEPPV
jgi:hypothetical protein